MNIKSYNLLRYLLIILLMLAPMRSILAMSALHCDMDDMSAMSSGDFMQQTNIVLIENIETAYFSGSAYTDPQSDEQQQKMNHQCCCCDANSCGSDCDMGMTVSLLMPVSPYSPVFVNTENLTLSSPELLVRELTPPSRPPLTHS